LELMGSNTSVTKAQNQSRSHGKGNQAKNMIDRVSFLANSGDFTGTCFLCNEAYFCIVAPNFSH